MAALVRSFVAASIVLVAACASIAGLEGPDNGNVGPLVGSEPDGSAGGGPASSSGGDQSSSGSSEQDGSAAIPDAAHDGPTDPPLPQCLPPTKPNDSACALASECCSNACSEDARCRGSCKASEGALCNPFDDECCIGLFCAAELPTRCRNCRTKGASPQNGNASTCCSRALDGDGKCQ